MQDIYDIERLCSKIAYGTVNARDCIALKITLERLPIVAGLLNENPSAKLSKIASEIDPMADIQSLLEHTIAPDPPVSTREGGMIRAGYHEQVDHFRDISTNSKGWITKLEAEEREQTGIKNLRVSYNKVFGYYIEVTKSYQNLVPYHYIRKQTLVNSERYITPALKEIEEQLLGAQDQLIALETKLFQEIRDRLGDNIVRLQKNALYLAEIDCYQSLAETAAMNKYVRPELTLDGAINIKSGRHPVVECSLKNEFVPNDAYLNGEDDRMLILTGPNMAGKSTYMRQIALIVLMAHIGSFVPAEQAIISVVDRIFTRVGAADDLAAGQSTFMVEMSEMANILHNSTADSLLLLDEIGRGTSTFDGLSIAWAVLEYIADKETSGAKTLFATHYHELTDLEGKLQGVKNYRTAVKEVGEDILFLHKVMPGGADKSFGIQVARLAGLPAPVLRRAKEILKTLEKIDMQSQRKKRQTDDEGQQLSLLLDAKKDELLLELTKIDVDSLSPLEALNALNMLHQQAKAINKAE